MVYKAFISYGHAADGKLAPAVQSALHRFAKPWYRLRAIRVFRDKTNLSANPDLWGSIEQALNESEYFILMSSPEAAASKWVKKEIDHWLKNKSADKILIVQTSGSIDWDDAAGDFDWGKTTALPENLKKAFPRIPLFVDLSWARKQEHLSGRQPDFQEAIARLAATLHGKPLDEIAGEDVQQHQRFVWIARFFITALILATIAAIVFGYNSYQNAQEARKQRDEAKRQRDIAIAGRLAAESRFEVDKNFDRSLLLASLGVRKQETWDTKSTLISGVLANPHLEAFLHGHRGRIERVVFSPDSKILASRDEFGKVILWDVFKHEPLGRDFPYLKRGRGGLAFSPNGKMLAAGSSGGIILWEIEKQKLAEVQITSGAKEIWDIRFGPNGSVLVSEGPDGVTFWDMANRKATGKLPEGARGPIAISADGRFLATASERKTIILWDWATKKKVYESQTYPVATKSIALTTRGDVLASTVGRYIVLLNTADFKEIGNPLSDAEMEVLSVAFSPDGNVLASGGLDRTLILSGYEKGRNEASRLTGYKDVITSVAFNPQGNTLASGGTDGKVVLWKPYAPAPRVEPTGIERTLEPKVTDKFDRIAGWSPDGRLLAITESFQPTREGKGAFILWDANTRKPLGPPLKEHRENVSGVSFGMEGKSFVSWDYSGKIVLWSRETGKPRKASLPPQAKEVTAVALSPDEKILALAIKTKDSSESAHAAVMVIFWDVLGQKELGRWQGSWMTHCLTFSPDSRTLAVDGEGEISLLDTGTQTPMGDSFREFEGLITDIAFSPDGKTLVASTNAEGSNDGALHLWEVATRRLLVDPLREHKVAVIRVAFSPDGKTLASAGVDGSLILWDFATRKPLGVLMKNPNAMITALAFNRDGDALAGQEGDHLAFFKWPLGTDFWRDRACGLANRNLNCDEWRQYLGDEPYHKTCPNLPGPEKCE